MFTMITMHEAISRSSVIFFHRTAMLRVSHTDHKAAMAIIRNGTKLNGSEYMNEPQSPLNVGEPKRIQQYVA